MTKCYKYTLIAFDHPDNEKSIMYRQNLTQAGLIKSINSSIDKGANLFSIRGFKEIEYSSEGGGLE